MTISLYAKPDGSASLQLNGSDALVIGSSGKVSLAATGFTDLGGTVGMMRNAKMSVTAASASATFTADEIVVESALGGAPYRLTNFNKTINLATTGAGGMDTGSAPVSGFVALYAIYNPTTQTAALLATNATSAAVTEVYSGANMPTGYTASALLSVWPTNASSQFVVGLQDDRDIRPAPQTALSTTTIANSATSLSVSAYVPKNAKRAKVNLAASQTNTGGQGISFYIGGNSAMIDQIPCIAAVSGTITSGATAAGDIIMQSAQTLYYIAASVGTFSASITITGYRI